MSLDEGLSRFIGRIYEAAYDGDAWHNVILELMTRTESRIAFLSCVDLRGGKFSKSNFYAPDSSRVAIGAEEYAAEMHNVDPSLAWARAHPFAGVCDTRWLLPSDEHDKHPYIVWNRSRFGTTHWRVLYTAPVDGTASALSLHPPADVGPVSRTQQRLHRLIFDHMDRAMRLAARTPNLEEASEAIIVLDTKAQILSMSARAEALLENSDCLFVQDRKLQVRDAEVASRLNQAISSAITSATVGGAGGGVRLPRESLRDWLVIVSPYPRFLDYLSVQTPGAILRFVNTDAMEPLTRTHAELFDLTARETDVAAALLKGHSIESLCSALQISRNTAKIHLQSLFRKTGTHRQSELIHLLAQISKP